MYPSPLRDGGYDIADFYSIHPDYGTVEDFRTLRRRGAPARHPRDRRPRHEPHLERPPVVPGGPLRPGLAEARLVRLVGHRRPLPGRADHLPRHRALELDLGPGRPGSTTGTASSRTSPTSTTTTPRCRRRCSTCCASGSTSGIDGFRLDAVPYLFEREGTNCENLPETHAYLKRVRAEVDAQLPRPRAARRGEPVAGGRRRVLRRRRRVPHGLPLPGHAAHLHGDPARGRDARSSRSSSRRRRSRRTRSGASSCATTTS